VTTDNELKAFRKEAIVKCYKVFISAWRDWETTKLLLYDNRQEKNQTQCLMNTRQKYWAHSEVVGFWVLKFITNGDVCTREYKESVTFHLYTGLSIEVFGFRCADKYMRPRRRRSVNTVIIIKTVAIITDFSSQWSALLNVSNNIYFSTVVISRKQYMIMYYFKHNYTYSGEPGYLKWHSDGLCAGRPGFNSWQGQEIFLCSTAFNPAVGPTQSSIQLVAGALPPGTKWPGVKLTTHLYLMPRSRMVEICLHSPYLFME
jgi:hypothetical protein